MGSIQLNIIGRAAGGNPGPEISIGNRFGDKAQFIASDSSIGMWEEASLKSWWAVRSQQTSQEKEEKTT